MTIKNLEVDLHTHTIASGHAFSTISEMAASAAERGLKMIAVTDHGLNMPGGPHEYYFKKLLDLPKVIHGVEILKGVESNILDSNGNLDVPEKILKSLDIVLAGFHIDTGYQGATVEENTCAMIAALENPYVNVIVHPGNPQFPVDHEKVIQAAKRTGKALEINNNSFLFIRPGSSLRCQDIIRKSAKEGILLTINSDAHSCFEIGHTEKAMEAANWAGIKSHQVLNTSVVFVQKYLQQTKQSLRKIS